MSRKSDRKPKDNAKNYKLFAINVYGNGLKPLMNEFLRRVKTGMRRTVFVIDVEEEISNATKDASRKKEADTRSLIVAAIDRCKRQYETVTQIIEREQKFDLLTYFQSNLNDKQNRKEPRSSSVQNTTASKSQKATTGKNKSAADLQCPKTLLKQHNKVGQPELLSKKKYINDHPADSKLFIAIVGSFDNQFYFDLARRGEPLQAIMHFLPTKTGYEMLIPNPANEALFAQTLQKIQDETLELRKQMIAKPVGIFTEELPVISKCLASKYSDEIFNELSWCLFDIEMLRQFYQLYYVNPYNEADVEMPKKVNLNGLYQVANSLSVQGNYLNNALPAVDTDIASILTYLDGLLNTLEKSKEFQSQVKTTTMAAEYADQLKISYHEALNDLTFHWSNAFSSIIHLKDGEHLFVEQSNTLLTNLVEYTNPSAFFNIYMTCLEYNLIRKHVINLYVNKFVSFKPYDNDTEPFLLPKYCKFYPNEDGVVQRLACLLDTYDDFDVEEISPGHKLYRFRRTYNEVFENEKLSIIPTLLCFRDFTLFQKIEFLEQLITPEKLAAMTSLDKIHTKSSSNLQNSNYNSNYDTNIFIRPHSMKEAELRENVLKVTFASNTIEKEKKLTIVDALNVEIKRKLSVGLPPGYSMLQGYNLENIRQEISVKSSKYHFDEGFIEMYQDRWCFDEINKNLLINVHDNQFCLSRPAKPTLINAISNNLKIVTKSGIAVRLLNEKEECSKVVLNYPNGLAVYYYEEYVENIWYLQESFNSEHKRIYSPFGAAIVHYKDGDLIKIMRYNGEVYELNRNEVIEDEDQEDISEFTMKTGSSSTYIEADYYFRYENVSISATTTSMQTGPKRRSKKNISMTNSQKSQLTRQLMPLIADELRFLNYISALHELTYKHLKLTTSVGKIFTINHKGQLRQEKELRLTEWHDYFANESYAKREDGVKMIWTHDLLKCFHMDGTVLFSKVGSMRMIDLVDYDSSITESSSHYGEADDLPKQNGLNLPDILSYRGSFVQLPERNEGGQSLRTSQVKIMSAHPSELTYPNKEYFANECEEEEEDRKFGSFYFVEFDIRHKSYPGIDFFLETNLFYDLKVRIALYAADEIYVEVMRKEVWSSNKDESDNNEMIVEEEGERERQILDMPEQKLIEEISTQLWISDKFVLTVYKEHCELNLLLARYPPITYKVRESLAVTFRFDDNIVNLFHGLVDAISTFKNYGKPKTEEIYFVEKHNRCCQIQGFEFYEKLPPFPKYTFVNGNTITMLPELKSISEKLENDYEWFNEDMEKFPRFPKRPKEKPTSKEKFPKILHASVFLKVPQKLRTTDQIWKFMQPLEKRTFKKLCKQVKESVQYFTDDDFCLQLKMLKSFHNWRRKHEENRRNLFIQQQRTGLYEAMLKHKVYPKYHQFAQEFRGHVKRINFFQFMQDNCMDKPANQAQAQKKIPIFC